MLDRELAILGKHRRVSRKAVLELGIHGCVHPLLDPGFSLFRFHIVLIRQETGQVGHVEFRQLAIVVRLNGFHEGIVHGRRAVHGDSHKLRLGAALEQVMVGFDVVIIPTGPGVDAGGLIAALKIAFAVIEPEGNIHTRDFLQPLLLGKELGKQGLFLAQL